MSATGERLLGRYLAAAEALAAASAGEGEGERGSETDTAATAMEQVLRRQAALVARTHKAGRHRGGGGGGVVVDEEEAERVRRRLDDVAAAATARLYAHRFDRVPRRWRCLYTGAKVLATHCRVLRALLGAADDDARFLDGAALDDVVDGLDRALIVAGGASAALGGAAWIHETMRLLEDHVAEQQQHHQQRQPPAPAVFSTREPRGRPALSAAHACPRHSGWTLARFEAFMAGAPASASASPRPVVFTDLTAHWPALTLRPWNRPAYLLSRTLGGRRLVPVELGRSYVDDGWGQALMPFGRFLARHVVDPSRRRRRGGGGGDAYDDAHDDDDEKVGYLAQHDLFRQIPALRNDMTVPDLCWAAVLPRPPAAPSPSPSRPPLAAPQLNAWFGPAGTITPLHTDGHHNLLCQVVGTKYVRLFPPTAAPLMCPRGPDAGVDMSNTSALDLGVLEGWDPPPPADGGPDALARRLDARDRLRALDYAECVLAPGDALLIPMGWWHYVRSLSVSFSVSFWWD